MGGSRSITHTGYSKTVSATTPSPQRTRFSGKAKGWNGWGRVTADRVTEGNRVPCLELGLFVSTHTADFLHR
eukprot:3069791-Prymnesium_polylepis.1